MKVQCQSRFQFDFFYHPYLLDSEHKIFYHVKIADYIEYSHFLKNDIFVHDKLDT